MVYISSFSYFFGPLEPKEMSYGGENEYNAGEVSVKDRDDGLTQS